MTSLVLVSYPDYKDSGVPWLGHIPAHWELMPGRACFYEKKTPNTGLQEKRVLSLSYGKIVVKPPEKLHGLVPASFETYQIVEPGDIICRPTDLQNDWNSLRFGLSQHRGIITSAYINLNTTPKMRREFGYLLLHAYDLMKIFYGLGSGLRQNLDWRDFKYLPILVPPLPEQRLIARYLDWADARIARLIDARERQVKLLEEYKQALIHQAVTGQIDVRTSRPYAEYKDSGVEWLGRVPGHWDVVELKRILRALIDCEHKTAPEVPETEFYVIRTSAVRNGTLNWEGTYTTSEEAYREWTKRGRPEPGDVIFTREAPIGEACIVPPNRRICLGQRTVLMKVDTKKYLAQFLVYMIYQGPPKHRIQLASQGSTVDHFNMDDIGWMRILHPPVREQENIIAYLSTHTDTIDAAIAATRRAIDLLREYYTRLIADVVTGKVDVREAAQRLEEVTPQEAEALEAVI